MGQPDAECQWDRDRIEGSSPVDAPQSAGRQQTAQPDNDCKVPAQPPVPDLQYFDGVFGKVNPVDDPVLDPPADDSRCQRDQPGIDPGVGTLLFAVASPAKQSQPGDNRCGEQYGITLDDEWAYPA